MKQYCNIKGSLKMIFGFFFFLISDICSKTINTLKNLRKEKNDNTDQKFEIIYEKIYLIFLILIFN